MLDITDDLTMIYDETGDDCSKYDVLGVMETTFKVLRDYSTEIEDSSMIMVSIIKGHTIERKDKVEYLGKFYQVVKVEPWQTLEDLISMKEIPYV